ncbi:MAG: ABC transporter substrate-binding protein [Desulfobacteraceae bacterium]|nr:ABC transporter substrate-binding protein [Desulfobacteraceae bacterium]
MKKTIIFYAVLVASVFIPSQSRSDEFIKFGCVEALTGRFKEVGHRYYEGTRYAAQVINQQGGLLGRKVKVIPIDCELKPKVASLRMSKAILKDNIKFFGKGISSKVMGAMASLAKEHNVIAISYGTEAASLTGKKCNRNFFRCSMNTDMHSNALAVWVAKFGSKKIFGIAQDYSFGREAMSAFKKKLAELKPSAEIVGEVYHKMGETDFAPYISRIIASQADIVFTPNFGSDLRLFLKQANQLGMRARIISYYLTDNTVIESLENNDAVIGSIAAECYMLPVPTQKSKLFADRYYKEFGVYPASARAKSYMAVMFWAEAVKKAGTDNVDAVITAWEGLTYESLTGKQYMRPFDHQNQMPAWIGEIVKKNRFFKHPYIDKAVMIPAKDVSVPVEETGCLGIAR